MSDLQCPARVLLVPERPEDERTLLSRIAERRPRAVYSSRDVAEPGFARLLAAEVGVGVAPWEPPRDGLTQARVVAALEGLSDLHRGETVVVVDGEAARALAAAGAAEGTLEVVLDSDGMVVRPWAPGSGPPRMTETPTEGVAPDRPRGEGVR